MATTRVQLKAIKQDFERAPTYVTPFFDPVKHEFHVGDKRYKAYERENAKGDEARWITKDEECPFRLSDNMLGIRLEHNMELNPDDSMDALILQVARDSGLVALNMQSVNTAGSHRLYIMDAKADAKAATLKADKAFEAMNIVRSMSLGDKRDLAFYMRQPVKTMDEVMVDGYVKNLALTDPDSVIKSTQAQDYKVRALLLRFIQYGLLTNEGGQIKNGSNVVGVDEDGAVQFMKIKSNRTFVEQLMQKLAEEEAKGGVINEPVVTSEKA